jgi:methylmalonyl-CoA mutase N-terminal domain/subunit
LQRVRRERDQREVERLFDRLVAVARNEEENLMPATIDLVQAGASMGEIVERLKALWGTYRETPVF